MRRHIKTAATVLMTVILLAAAAINVYIMVCGAKGRAAVIGGSCIMRISTGSMEPSLYVGDFIRTKAVPASELNEGDIISFYSEDSEIYGMINTHRIVRRVDGGFITKGDANPVEDDAIVHEERIIGKYMGKMRYFRWLGSFANGKKLVLLAVILLTLGISIYEVITISKITTGIENGKDEAAEAERERLIREAVEEEKRRLREADIQAETAQKAKPAEQPEIVSIAEETAPEQPIEETKPVETYRPERGSIPKPVKSYPMKKSKSRKKSKRRRR